MYPWKNILVATDFSECSRRALRDAYALAGAANGSVTLVHVTHMPVGLDSTVLIHPTGAHTALQMADYLEAKGQALLEAEVAAINTKNVPTVTRSILGDPVKEISKLAAAMGADLLVVGTHGRTGWRHMVLGSIAERLIQASSIPVLTSKSPIPCVEDTVRKEVPEDTVTAEQMG